MKNLSGKHRTIHRILSASLSVLFFAACIVTVFAVLRTHKFDYLQISSLKIFVLIIIVVVGVIVLTLGLNQRTCRYINIILINVFFCLLGAEFSLRIMDHKIPLVIVEMLPKEDRERLATNKGGFTKDSIIGEEMLYHWPSNANFEGLPWLKIDSNGYRNPVYPKSVDIVILGDSVSVAPSSEHGPGDILRDKGLTALNLAFSGYGPSHQRDAYQKYVLSTEVDHRLVIINFCYCNDVTEAISYEQILNNGGNWRDYLRKSPSRTAFPFDIRPPWILSILFHLPYELVQIYKDKFGRIGEDIIINLPRGKVKLARGTLLSKPQFLKDKYWEPTLTALSEIMILASSANAKVILAYYPNLAQIYLPYLPKTKSYREAAQHDLQHATKRLARLAKKYNAEFVDYTRSIQKANAQRVVTENEDDYHPNLLGVKVMMDMIFPVITKYNL